MAEIPKKPKKNGKGAPPPPVETKGNLTNPGDGELVNLSFKVSPEFRKEFRIFAAENDLSHVDLLKDSFREYKHLKK